jgi:hypothetical protein
MRWIAGKLLPFFIVGTIYTNPQTDFVRIFQQTYCHEGACDCKGSQNVRTWSEEKLTYMRLFDCTKLIAVTPRVTNEQLKIISL